MINIVSYSTAKGISGKGGSGGGGSITNYNNYSGIQPLYLWGNYFDGTSDIEGNLTSNGTIRANDIISKNSIRANIIDVLSATTEYFKTAYLESTGNANVSGDTHICQDLQVDGSANIGSDTTIGGNVNISGNTFTEGSSTVHHDMTVGGDGKIYGDAVISGTTTTTDIYSENITNTGTIRTKDLEVTGTAHFFELIIDKIKAAGGAILLTPADGFRVDYVEDVTNGKKLYFRSTDNSGKGIMNMWKAGDQAICQSFNQATVGTQYDVSNKYWWSLVTEVSEQPVQKTVSGETNDYHYITISTQSGYDEQDRPYYDGTINCEVGDEVAMLGYRGTDDVQRQSAIYMAAYRSVDLGLTAPHFAEYQGIDDFNLASHRMSYIDANGARFVGGLYVDANTSVQDYVTNETTEIRNEFKFDINGLTSKVEHKSRPNIVSNNDWHDQDNAPLYQENDELYEVSGTTECTAYPPVMYLNAGTYTPSIYGYGKFKTIRYGESKNNLENYLPVDTMINFNDTWNDLPRSQAIFLAPYDGYYAIGVELMDSSYSGDTEYFDYIEEESSGETSGNTVQTEIQLSVDDVKVNRTEQSSVQTYPPSYDKVVYRSSNPSAVTVDEYGNITGVGEGNAIIYAYIPEAYSGGYHYLPSEDYKNVQCSASAHTVTTITNTQTQMQSGHTYTVSATVTPDDYPGEVRFETSDNSIATVNGNQLNVIGVGNFTLYAYADTVISSGYTYAGSSATKQIEAVDYYRTQTSCNISLNSNDIYTKTTTNANVSTSPITLPYVLSTSDSSIATVDNNGVVSGVSEGNCYVIVTVPEYISGDTVFLTSSASTQMHVTQMSFTDLDIILEGSSQPCIVSGNTQGNQIRPGDSLNDINWGYSPIEYSESGITLTSNYSAITPTLSATTVSGDFRVSKFAVTIPEHLEKESYFIGLYQWERPKKPVLTLTGNDQITTSGGTPVYVNSDQNTVTVDFKPYRIDYTYSGSTAPVPNNDWGNGNWDYTHYYENGVGYGEFLGTPTTIPSNCMSYKQNVTTIDLSDMETVTMANSNSFNGASNLTSIILPPNLTNISDSMFEYCNILPSINLPTGINEIGDSAFRYCSKLSDIDIPSGVTYIDTSTFNYCSSLSGVSLNNVTVLGQYAFARCTSLSAITLSDNITEIGQGCFYNCNQLQTIHIPNSVTIINQETFRNCQRLASVDNLHDGITEIGQYAFAACNLSTITIPSTVTSIGMSAFSFNFNLSTVTILATTPPTLGNGAMDRNGMSTKFGTLYVPSGSVNAYKAIDGYSRYFKNILSIS